MARRSASEVKIIRDAVWSLDHVKRRDGTLLLFDGRKWPIIRRLRDEGLVTIEDFRISGSHDVIELRATEAARKWVSENPTVDEQIAGYDRTMERLGLRQAS